MEKIKITHIITGLNMGGAEAMLYKTLKFIDKKRYNINVISLLGEGVYSDKIRELGIDVISLNMKVGFPLIKSFIKARKHVRGTHIIQTWMYHADLFGFILFKLSKAKKLIWGIRRSNLDSRFNKLSTMLIAKLNSKLSKKVDIVVSCSIKAKEAHLRFGYFNKNMVVIPNGFEMNFLKNNSSYSKEFRSIINQPKDTPLILHVGRWNALKDHENLLKALKEINKYNIKFHAVLVGPNIDEDNYELADLINKYKLQKYVSLLGVRKDIPMIMSGADIFVSSSRDEGFPNVIGEAMACETPCVVTDAGDSSYIVGETGIVVPTNNFNALAKGIIDMLSFSEAERKHLGVLARRRVISHFDILKVVKQFEELYQI